MLFDTKYHDAKYPLTSKKHATYTSAPEALSYQEHERSVSNTMFPMISFTLRRKLMKKKILLTGVGSSRIEKSIAKVEKETSINTD